MDFALSRRIVIAGDLVVNESPKTMKTSKFTSIATLATLALVGFGSAAIAAPLYVGPFGDNTSSNCGPAWNGDCESGWQAAGANNSVKLVSLAEDPGAQGIRIKAGGASSNKISSTFDVEPDSALRIFMPLQMLGGTADFTTKVRFKTSSGELLETKQKTESAANTELFNYEFAVPAGAATARVVFELDNASSASVFGVLGHVYAEASQGDPPDDLPEGPTISNHPDVDECKYYAGSCDCDISCTGDTELVRGCITTDFPMCEKIPACYCAEVETQWQ